MKNYYIKNLTETKLLVSEFDKKRKRSKTED